MTRTLGGALATDIGAATAETADLLLLDFADLSNASTPVYLTTAGQDISWNGHTWEAVGGRLALDALGESGDGSSDGIKLNLSGVDQTIMALILGSRWRGRTATVYYAHLNQATGAVVADPVLMFTGLMNGGVDLVESRGDFGGGTVDITLRLTARISELVRVRGVRTNVSSHQSTIPGASADTGFQNVPQLPGRRVYWGMKDPADLTAIPPYLLPPPGRYPGNNPIRLPPTPLTPSGIPLNRLGGGSAPPSNPTKPSFNPTVPGPRGLGF